jgi:L-seryl-tRNA(Ser) seleniumtransferase
MTKSRQPKNRARVSRREVFRGGSLAAAGLLAGSAPAGAARMPASPDVYTSIGVKPFINLTAAVTINGGLLTLPNVKEAMEEASYFSVNMDELLEAVGKRLAELFQCEAAMVASGAAGALTHATSACLAGANPERIQQLPDLTGLRSEVIMPRASRNTYDHAIRAVGITMITVDTREEFHRALSHDTAMIAVLGNTESRSEIRLEEMAAAGRKYGAPVVVDASPEWPQSPDPYIKRGADLVAYSGGKICAGPQCSGFLIGREDLIHAARMNSAPHHSFGRMMKVGKEEIMGALAAAEFTLGERSHQNEVEKWTGWLRRLDAKVKQVPGVKTTLKPPPGKNPHPVLDVEWDPERIGYTAGELHDYLMSTEPRIQTHAGGEGHSFPIRIGNCREDQIDIVANRLAEVLLNAPKPKPKREAPPAADISGRWDAELMFTPGSARHTLHFEAKGNKLSGTHDGQRGNGELTGSISGDHVRFRSQLIHDAERTGYSFDGRLKGSEITGDLDLGEYGKARFKARRHEYGRPVRGDPSVSGKTGKV